MWVFARQCLLNLQVRLVERLKIVGLVLYFLFLVSLCDKSFLEVPEVLELLLAWPDGVTLRYTICNMFSYPLYAILAILCMNH